MSAETEQNIFGGYDDIEFDGIEELTDLITVIKELDNESYKFVMASTMRRLDN